MGNSTERNEHKNENEMLGIRTLEIQGNTTSIHIKNMETSLRLKEFSKNSHKSPVRRRLEE